MDTLHFKTIHSNPDIQQQVLGRLQLLLYFFMVHVCLNVARLSGRPAAVSEKFTLSTVYSFNGKEIFANVLFVKAKGKYRH